MSGSKFCRLCLNTVLLTTSSHYFTTWETKKMLVDIFPSMNIGLTSSISLCEECFNNVNFAYRVKEGFVRKRQEFLFLQQPVLHCSVCFGSKTPFTVFLQQTSDPYKCFKNMIQVALSDLVLTDGSVNICDACWAWTKKIFTFKMRCFKLEEGLKFYCSRKGLIVMTENHFHDFLYEQYFFRMGTYLQKPITQQNINLTVSQHEQYFNATGEVFSNLNGYLLEQVKTGLDADGFSSSNDEMNKKEIEIGDCKLQLSADEFEQSICIGSSDEETDDNIEIIGDVKILDDDTDCDVNNNKSVSNFEGFHKNHFPKVIHCDTPEFSEFYNKYVANHLDSDCQRIEGALSSTNEIVMINGLPCETVVRKSFDPLLSGYSNYKEDKDETNFINLCEDDLTDGNNADNLVMVNDDCFEVFEDKSSFIDLTNIDSYMDDSETAEEHSSNVTNDRMYWGCYVCVAKFVEKRSMRGHLLNHEDPWNKYGRFQCWSCPYKANWKGSVTRHEYFHTPENEKKYAGVKVRYLCPYCSAVYLHKGDIQSHMNEHIISWKRFECLDCLFTTNSSRTLRMHYITCHCPRADPNFYPYHLMN